VCGRVAPAPHSLGSNAEACGEGPARPLLLMAMISSKKHCATVALSTSRTWRISIAMQPQAPSWGDWMGAWKSGSEVDKEAERIDRQKAAVGGDTVSQLKDLNVLIIGCRGVGTETAKNLILSNVGAVGVCDDVVCCTRDMGANCYISSEAVSSRRSRSAAVLPQLKSLNPFCRVDVFPSIEDSAISTRNFLGTNRPISTLVLTVFLPKAEVIRINEACRKTNIAFVFAVNAGVTSFIFSDFGLKHTITDTNGNPVQV
jgi:hypothetical protein